MSGGQALIFTDLFGMWLHVHAMRRFLAGNVAYADLGHQQS